ncbi:MAG: adenylosuccinate lyase [Gammaproteobacteria bacterium AqS3]|nr:adenylosuccinate lyase [Gammaproteobacteria bacterium AqS3]
MSTQAISPLEGRYAARLENLRGCISETALARERVRTEICWFIGLLRQPEITGADATSLSDADLAFLHSLYQDIDDAALQRIGQIERTINHDVKAVEYYIKERLAERPALAPCSEWVHFACTSEDINSTAYALMLSSTREHCSELLRELLRELAERAQAWAGIPALARTHGQSASPTTLGKEIVIFISRLDQQVKVFSDIRMAAKLSGATGSYAAHLAACPDFDWPALSRTLLNDLGLDQAPITTQIEPHDGIAELLHSLIRINSVLLDAARDFWGYIALGWFIQRPAPGEVGSSTMPHKVNPIDFENAEGNLGIANALAGHLAEKLTVSRWQRDLSDSTALRNLGAAFAHSVLAWQSIAKGLGKLEPNAPHLQAELDAHWEVLAEAVQTVMRRAGLPEPYERLKDLTRGAEEALSRERLHEFILGLGLPDDARERLLALTPSSYTGHSERQARQVLQSLKFVV